jgi:hypothetical protein
MNLEAVGMLQLINLLHNVEFFLRMSDIQETICLLCSPKSKQHKSDPHNLENLEGIINCYQMCSNVKKIPTNIAKTFCVCVCVREESGHLQH